MRNGEKLRKCILDFLKNKNFDFFLVGKGGRYKGENSVITILILRRYQMEIGKMDRE